MTLEQEGVTTPDAVAAGGIRLAGVRRDFGGRQVLDGVDLMAREGEFVALLGASGSGKTTLLKILAGIDRQDAGQVAVPDPVSVVYQEHRLLPWRRVEDNIGLVLTGPDRRARVTAALHEVGLAEHARAWPGELSGGQAQRVAIARALVTQPRLLLLDEPFASLDALTRLRMHALVTSLHQAHHATTLLVTHDVDEALALSDRVLVLHEGRISLSVDATGWNRTSHGSPGWMQARRRLLRELGLEDD